METSNLRKGNEMNDIYYDRDKIKFNYIANNKRARKLAKHLSKAYKQLVMLGDELDTISSKDKASIQHAKFFLSNCPLFSKL